jgi:hypothetical protein
MADGSDELIMSRHHASHANGMAIGFGALTLAAVLFLQRRRLLALR